MVYFFVEWFGRISFTTERRIIIISPRGFSHCKKRKMSWSQTYWFLALLFSWSGRNLLQGNGRETQKRQYNGWISKLGIPNIHGRSVSWAWKPPLNYLKRKFSLRIRSKSDGLSQENIEYALWTLQKTNGWESYYGHQYWRQLSINTNHKSSGNITTFKVLAT